MKTDRFKDWTIEDYDKEIKRVRNCIGRLEKVIPKLDRAIKRSEQERVRALGAGWGIVKG